MMPKEAITVLNMIKQDSCIENSVDLYPLTSYISGRIFVCAF